MDFEIVSKLAAAFNEWQNRHIKNPENFITTEASEAEFAKYLNAGLEPTYGLEMVAYLQSVLADLGLGL